MSSFIMSSIYMYCTHWDTYRSLGRFIHHDTQTHSILIMDDTEVCSWYINMSCGISNFKIVFFVGGCSCAFEPQFKHSHLPAEAGRTLCSELTLARCKTAVEHRAVSQHQRTHRDPRSVCLMVSTPREGAGEELEKSSAGVDATFSFFKPMRDPAVERF